MRLCISTAARWTATILAIASTMAIAPSTAAGVSAQQPQRSAPAAPSAKRDAQILRFFRTHPRLARTEEGQRQILAALLRRVGRLEAEVRSLRSARATPEGAIRYVFGRYADQALRVAWCETGGTYSVWARNPNPPEGDEGDYLGLFQMGDYARGRYGHGWTPLEQARAAYAYFADAGYDWSPWECRPW